MYVSFLNFMKLKTNVNCCTAIQRTHQSNYIAMFFGRVCWDSNGDSWIELGANHTACYKKAVSLNIWIPVQVPDIDFDVVLSSHEECLCRYRCQIAGKRF